MTEYFNKWLHISARAHDGTEEQRSYLHKISKEQEDGFFVFLGELEDNKGYYPADLSYGDIVIAYLESYTNSDTTEYLDLIGDLFPNSKFTHLSINYDNQEYGYKNY